MEKPVLASAAKKAKAKVRPVSAKAKGEAGVSLLTPAEIHEVFSRFAAAMPHPKTELEHLNPFTLLVAVVLSAQATDVGVNKATKTLFQLADTPQKMVDLGEDRLRDAIKTIGLFNAKAKNVIALSRALAEEHGGKVPQTREALEKLPGVGRKSANVVLNVAFEQPTIAVDTHIFRVANRTGLAPGKNPLQVELGLERIAPPEFVRNVHHWHIMHGRYVCTAKKPECRRCIIADLCKFEPKTPSPSDSGKSRAN